MKRLAIRSVLSGKVADGQLAVVNELSLERPRTKEIAGLLDSLGIERSALVVTGNADRMVHASARNLTRIKALPAAYLNVVDMLTHRDLVMTVAAVRRCEELWGGDRARQRRPLPVQVAVRSADSAAVAGGTPVAEKPRRPRAAKAKAAEEAPAKTEETVEAEVPAATDEVVEAAAEAPAQAQEGVAAPAAKAPRRPRAPRKPKTAEEPAGKPEEVVEAPSADAEQESS
jgi:hypothetical protein